VQSANSQAAHGSLAAARGTLVPIDRAAILKNADKLLKQGKLQPAIAEYVRIVEDQPRDFSSVNLLGDLYVRAKQIDRAVEQFVRIADALSEDGFLPKAAALYKKVIKIKPDHEHSLLQAAEIATSQNLYADARAYLTVVADKKAAAGDKRGNAQMRIRLGNLDPSDYPARINAARARIDINDTPGAVRDLKEIAVELTEKKRPTEAVAALREAGNLAPDDESIRTQLFDVYLASADLARAGECATTAAQFKLLAGALESAGRASEALEMQCAAARLDPADTELRVHLAKTFVARGDMTAAAQYLSEEVAGNDSQLLLTVTEMRLRGGEIEQGLAIARRVLDAEPGRRDQVALVGWNVAEQAPDAGFAVVELAADLAARENDWGAAAAALQEFVTRVPSHLAALCRLVEICVDGSLEATLYSAQAQLADAYITAGMATEARFISEDLVAREPWDRSNIERFRKTLVMTNEPDPDALIAERLSGQLPFTSTDLSADFFPPFEAPAPPPAPAAGSAEPGSRQTTVEPVNAATEVPPAASAQTVDIGSMLNASAAAPSKTHAETESVEVDLSIVLNEKSNGGPEKSNGGPAVAGTPVKIAELDLVFEQFRDEASRRSGNGNAESEYARGVALHEAGDLDGAIGALEAVSRSPKLRFAVAARLGRIFKQRGMTVQSLEWMERAAQAPATNADEHHQLLFELAEALESNGEVGRALAICLELQSDAGAYRDINTRIDRLAKVQARE
jgi:tetratricopeptide (TPR) repeat protein